MSALPDPQLAALLDRLHVRSAGEGQALAKYFGERAREGSLDWNAFDDRTHQFLSDKLVALDRDKAELCYELCRSLRAKRVVEAGTSYGVSTLYLAAAVRENVKQDGGRGVVIATEYEPANGLRTLTLPYEGGLELTTKHAGPVRGEA